MIHNFFCKKHAEDILSTVSKEEAAYLERIKEAAALTIKGGHRFLFLAGPSCSGKTTTGKLLTSTFSECGKRVFAFSTDDFFRDKIYAPKNSDGTPNYDNLEHSDPDRICKVLQDLARGRKTEVPIFDFQTGNRSEKTVKVDPTDYDLFLLEGIHALNDRFLSSLVGLEKPICFYLDVEGRVQAEEADSCLSPQEIRFCRRLIRDAKHRNASAEWTFTLWESVIRSEREILHPFRKNAARIIDTGLSYEIGVERDEAILLLETVSQRSPFKQKAEILRKKLSCFPSLPKTIVPYHSVLREFID